MLRVFLLSVIVICLFFPNSCADNAQIRYQGFGQSFVKDTIPDSMLPGHSYPVIMTFLNNGLISWDNDIRKVGLLYEGDDEMFSVYPSFVEISKGVNITPGSDVSFALTILPLGSPGTYSLPFSVVMRSATGDQKITETYFRKVVIVPADGISLKDTGSIFIESSVPDLEITSDSSYMGKTPVIMADLAPGTYNIRLLNVTPERTYKVDVSQGVMTHLYISNESVEPVIERKKVERSDSVSKEISGAEVLLIAIIIIVSFVGSLVLFLVFYKRKSKEEEWSKKVNLQKKTDEDEQEGFDPEKELLDRIHRKTPLFEAIQPYESNLSGISGAGKNHQKTGEASPKRVINSGPPKGYSSKSGTFAKEHGASPNVDVKVQNLQINPGSASVSLGIFNRSSVQIKVEDKSFGPGGSGEISLELKEPKDDLPEVVLPLNIFTEGREFLYNLFLPYNRGVALLARGVVGKAYEYFRSLLVLEPDRIDALYEQAKILLGWGLEDEAVIPLNEIIKRDPGNEEALEALKSIKDRREERARRRIPDKRPVVSGYPDDLSDRYTVISLLGEDQFSRVFLVRKNDTGDLRALKFPHSEQNPVSSLLTEISLLYQLKHPYILRMYRAELQPIIFLELEYVSGCFYEGQQRMNLSDFPVPLPEKDWLPLIEKIADGIAYLHRQGVRHYHLSPRNILLDEPMIPKITGFLIESGQETKSNNEDILFGRSPEQIDPDFFGNPGKRTDIYQFGAIWLWLATGEVLQCEGSGGGLSMERNYLSRHNPAYEKYDPLLQRLIATFKKDRYHGIESFTLDLNRVIRL